MKSIGLVALASLVLALFGGRAAATPVTIPSCYAANPGLGLAAPRPARELFVMIDQTTLFDAELRQAVKASIAPLLAPGTAVFLVRFSAFAQGRYMSVVEAGTIETPPSDNQRFHANARVLATFDQCMRGQLLYARRTSMQAIDQSFAGSSSALMHSDVMASLRDLSARVRSSVARDRIVLVASDMLENSSVTSFYTNRGIRRLDPAIELRKAAGANMLGDFAGARIYAIGTGLLPDQRGGAEVYRDVQAVEALRQFWTQYFARSNARLIAMGTPVLLRPIQ